MRGVQQCEKGSLWALVFLVPVAVACCAHHCSVPFHPNSAPLPFDAHMHVPLNVLGGRGGPPLLCSISPPPTPIPILCPPQALPLLPPSPFFDPLPLSSLFLFFTFLLPGPALLLTRHVQQPPHHQPRWIQGQGVSECSRCTHPHTRTPSTPTT